MSGDTYTDAMWAMVIIVATVVVILGAMWLLS